MKVASRRIIEVRLAGNLAEWTHPERPACPTVLYNARLASQPLICIESRGRVNLTESLQAPMHPQVLDVLLNPPQVDVATVEMVGGSQIPAATTLRSFEGSVQAALGSDQQ